MSRRTIFKTILMALVGIDLGMVALAVILYPAVLNQHLSYLYVLKPSCILLGFGIAAIYVARAEGIRWETVRRNAAMLGIATGGLEGINILIEKIVPRFASQPWVSIGFMLVAFISWGGVAAWTSRSSGSMRAGIFAGVVSAGICMLIAVAAGFAIEIVLVPPDPAHVSTWAEFKRSGWTDARAFGLANTLDSGFTHLLIAPIVALIFGTAGSALMRLAPFQAATRTR